jgi:hypothetical protein
MSNGQHCDAYALLCSGLRGEKSPDCEPHDWGKVVALAIIHGVAPLLRARVGLAGWPVTLIDALRAEALQRAMWELRHQHVLSETLRAMNESGLRPVIFKGTALGYSLYPDPCLRTRADTDLLIPTDARNEVHELLIGIGYERELAVSGELVSYQANYTLRSVDGSVHTLDVHWRINNSELLAGLFTYEELRGCAQPIPQLSDFALGPPPVHSLLLASMHRGTHRTNPYYSLGEARFDADRLVWLCDIDLLSRNFSAHAWQHLVQLAKEKGLCAVTLDALDSAASALGTKVPAIARASLAASVSEPPALYLHASKARQQWMDFVALGSARKRLTFLRETFFPPANYMRNRYRLPEPQLLPWLYLKRAIHGASALASRRTRS